MKFGLWQNYYFIKYQKKFWLVKLLAGSSPVLSVLCFPFKKHTVCCIKECHCFCASSVFCDVPEMFLFCCLMDLNHNVKWYFSFLFCLVSMWLLGRYLWFLCAVFPSNFLVYLLLKMRNKQRKETKWHPQKP